MTLARCTRRWFAVDSQTLAQRLLGCVLVRILDDGTRLAGRIVETEAYVGVNDQASHAYAGRRTQRNESMYAAPGTAYVYFTYGMHYCANVVCGKKDEPVAVLLRALEPLEGLAHMRLRRGQHVTDVGLCSGPAKLCQALQIDRALDGEDLVTSPRFFIEKHHRTRQYPAQIQSGSRIGLGEVGAWKTAPLRWWIKANAHVSR